MANESKHIQLLLRQNTPGSFTQLRQLGRRRALTLYRYQDKNPYYYGRLSEVSGETLELIDDLPYKRGFRYYLPLPLQRVQRSLAVVCAYKDRDKVAIYWVLDESCSLVMRGCTPLKNPPAFFHIGAGFIWLVSQSEVTCVQVEKMPRPRRYELVTDDIADPLLSVPISGHVDEQAPRQQVGDWLGLFSELGDDGIAERLHWFNLEQAGHEQSVTWGDTPFIESLVVDDQLYLCGTEGLMRATPEDDPVTVYDGAPPSALAVSDDTFYMGTHFHPEENASGVVALTRSEMEPSGFTELPHGVVSIHPIERGVVVCSGSQWTWLPEDGDALTSRTGPTDSIGFARLSDGTTAVNASRELLIIPPEGAVIQLKLPSHGRILDTVSDHFLFDPDLDLAMPPDDPDRARDLKLRLASNYEFNYIDRRGERLAGIIKYDGEGNTRYKSPVRQFYNGSVPGDDGVILPDKVLLTEKNEPTLWLWSPPS